MLIIHPGSIKQLIFSKDIGALFIVAKGITKAIEEEDPEGTEGLENSTNSPPRAGRGLSIDSHPYEDRRFPNPGSRGEPGKPQLRKSTDLSQRSVRTLSF